MTPTATLIQDDCLNAMRQMPDASIDAIITDPPYGLSFMGKKWDYDVPSVEIWAECLRVLKPGGHLLAFAGTRTQHRMAVRIEDAGFEIRDMIAWVYGSGFPKSLDVSKAIDKAAGVEFESAPATGVGFMNTNGAGGYNVTKNQLFRKGESTPAARQWSGWGTALKPALEPITVARKPLVGTVAENVLAHGTGALNIDWCRVAADDAQGGTYTVKRFAPGASVNNDGNWKQEAYFTGEMKPGRWPANLIHDGSEEVLRLFPDGAKPKPQRTAKRGGSNWHGKKGIGSPDQIGTWPEDQGGSAARFFYCAKASKADRNSGGENSTHPTVKPTDLMRYLCRLVTPPKGTILDPFMGSGSTGKAALLEDFNFIGIERDPQYFQIAQKRATTPPQTTLPLQ